VGGFSVTLTLRIIPELNITAERPIPAWAHFSPPPIFYMKSTAIRRNIRMWNPGEIVSWRGIRNQVVWHVQPTIVVRDSPEELVLTLLPGTECMAEETYPLGKNNGKRWWDFKANDWKLAKYIWRTNRLLLILEPEKCYSIILFWEDAGNEFLCYYINFQVPYQRRDHHVDTLDLELDLIIKPDLSMEWKDEDDYQKAMEQGLITSEWTRRIEDAQLEILDRLESRKYPFDGSWLDWLPDPSWFPPKLPENWDRV
jgi:protein associated with RNAse G/E